jgi:hypothetical protein
MSVDSSGYDMLSSQVDNICTIELRRQIVKRNKGSAALCSAVCVFPEDFVYGITVDKY